MAAAGLTDGTLLLMPHLLLKIILIFQVIGFKSCPTLPCGSS
jgi:hypothetical protein